MDKLESLAIGFATLFLTIVVIVAGWILFIVIGLLNKPMKWIDDRLNKLWEGIE